MLSSLNSFTILPLLVNNGHNYSPAVLPLDNYNMNFDFESLPIRLINEVLMWREFIINFQIFSSC